MFTASPPSTRHRSRTWPTLRGSLLSLALLAVAGFSQAQEAPPLDGRWSAAASLGGEEMVLTLDLDTSTGALVARLTVPAERVLGLRVDGFRLADRDVSFRIPHPDHPMGFAGRIEGEVIDGALSMGERELPLLCRRAGAIPVPPYAAIQVSFPGAERTVEGSFFLPPGEGPHPALVLFHATSTAGRDDQRFYADLAARAGFAALIYDRRPVPMDLARLSRADFLAVVADAEAAVRFVRERAGIDAARVGVGGLSQGAWISAIVASRVPQVAFVIALSPPGVPLQEIDIHQSNLRLERSGVSGSELSEANQLLVDLHAASRGAFSDVEALRERLGRARAKPWAPVLDLPEQVPTAAAPGPLLRWSAGDLDPTRTFGLVRVPVLLAFGGRDERLPTARCEEQLRASFARAGNEAVTVLDIPDANHALIPAPDLESRLTAWIRERAGSGGR